eukprot:CAMPEP_0170874790 /NCGR_PEP_ID=MMETSP0734-20130129/28446_1 /TAXON_ID=186038 /ORGANISM="Fragilariopsis kerguelensis, Strain L26-C5" /LENGTH=989 /DNA_ID=CAMNT_0011255983 /DNA_START=1100 /DNA_END=4069 /DNA_ORIENTATION=-
MSGWLSSVNNLLENLDGQAETVAETVADNTTTASISNNLMKLNKTLTNNNIIKSAYNNDDDDEYDEAYDDEEFTTDEDDYDDDDDDDNDDDEGEYRNNIDSNDGDYIIDNPNVTVNNSNVDIVSSQISDKGVEDKDDEERQQDELSTPVAITTSVINSSTNEDGLERQQTYPDTSNISNTGSSETSVKNDNSNTNRKSVPVKEQTISSLRQRQHWKKLNKQVVITLETGLSGNRNIDDKNDDDRVRTSTPDYRSSISDLSHYETESLEKDENLSFTKVDDNREYSHSNSNVNADLNDTAKISLSTRKCEEINLDANSSLLLSSTTTTAIEKKKYSNVSTKSEKAVAMSKKQEEEKSAPSRPPTRHLSPKPQQMTVVDNTIKKNENHNAAITATMSSTRVSHSDNTPPTINGSNNNEEIRQQQQQEEMTLLKQQHQQVLSSKNKNIQSLQLQLSKIKTELSEGKTKYEQLFQQRANIDEKLRISETEIEAQAEELRRAGEEMENIRTISKEEREDLLDDHDEEREDIQREHQLDLDKIRQEYERTITEWKDRFESEESLRQQQGGDSINELRDANQREKDALKKLAYVTTEKMAFQTKLDLVVGHETELQQQVESSLESTDAVAAREIRVRDELDEAATMHAKQIAQRQKREAELEQTVLELGSALTLAKQQHFNTPAPNEPHQQDEQMKGYKEKFEQIAEELETTRVELTMEMQRREALQQELNEVSKERKEEVSLSQAQQHQHDRKVADLESTIYRLQASVRALQSGQRSSSVNSDDSITTDNDHNNDEQRNQNNQNTRRQLFQKELEGAKREISKLSEQLLRHQGHGENAKSEILALKGRLRAANTRVEETEKAQYASSAPRAYEVENGDSTRASDSANKMTFSTRKRIKGGSRGARSIRSVLPCFGSGRSNTGEVALTIDAIDSWMIDTGSFMRHEPFARLGLSLYFIILHLWSFALVVFHTTEVEHGDFGSMDSNPRHWREHTGT